LIAIVTGADAPAASVPLGGDTLIHGAPAAAVHEKGTVASVFVTV
jgi:hypothetical protein